MRCSADLTNAGRVMNETVVNRTKSVSLTGVSTRNTRRPIMAIDTIYDAHAELARGRKTIGKWKQLMTGSHVELFSN